MSKTQLLPAQERFIDEYMIDYNATQAMLRVHPDLTQATARARGHVMLQHPLIREEVDRRLAEIRASRQLTVANVEYMIRDLAEVDVLDIFKDDGTLRPLSEIPPHARRAIASVEYTEDILGCVTVKVKLWDKKSALEMLGKYKKMFTDKVELGGADGKKIEFVIEGIAKP